MSCYLGSSADPTCKHGVSVYNGCSGCADEGLYEHDPKERIHRMLARAEKAEARVVKLEAALRRYGVHKGCMAEAGYDGCTCGLDAALSEKP